MPNHLLKTTQSLYLDSVSEDHRKQFGQFFTHPEVAKFMVDWVLQSGHKTLYDPAFGLGALIPSVSDKRDIRLCGSEIDPVVLKFWERTAKPNTPAVVNEDYLLSWGKRHRNIICNPPYKRFQKFLNRGDVFEAFRENLGLSLSGHTNTASAFLLKSLSELDGTGRLAYIMPLEFLNTGYGKLVKAKLLEHGHLVAIISLDCEKDVFPDSITSAGILLYDASVQYQSVGFYSVSSIASLSAALDKPAIKQIPLIELNPNSKWLTHFDSTNHSVKMSEVVTLNHYGGFSRGIATGANAFFAIKPSVASAIGLQSDEWLPCISKSEQIRKPTFSVADYEYLVRKDAPVLLFRAGHSPSQEAARYIGFGESKGYHLRFLTKNRSPWYKTETRNPSPLLVGVFSRGDYKVIRNTSGAVNLSCFHGFRPNFYGNYYLDHLFLYLSSQSGRTIVSLSMRKYGDSLKKFEPNDLNEAYVPSPTIFDEIPNEEVKNAVRYVEETGSVPEDIDRFFGNLIEWEPDL